MPGISIQFEAIDEASPTITNLSKMMFDLAANGDRLATELTNSAQRMNTGLKKIGQGSKEADDSMTTLKKTGDQLFQQFIGLGSVVGVTAFFTSAAQGALQEEEALRRLEFAVNATGGSFDQARGQILAFAEQQQALTQFSDTQTFETLGRLVRVTGDTGQAMQAARLAFGLASASGKELGSVLDLLSPILQGDASRMRALKNEFGAFIGNADTAQEVIDALSGRFLGAAENQKGFGVEIAKTKNLLGDLKDTIGVGVLQAFNPFLGAIKIGAGLFETMVSVAVGGVLAIIEHVKTLGLVLQDAFSFDFSKSFSDRTASIKSRFDDLQKNTTALNKALGENILEIDKKYFKQKTDLIENDAKIRVGISDQEVKNAEEVAKKRKEKGKEAHDFITNLEKDRLKEDDENLEARLELIEIEKNEKLVKLQEYKDAKLLTDQELADAEANAKEIAKLKSKEAQESLDQDLKAINDAAEAVGKNMASSLGSAFADIIVEGKNMQQAFDAAFKQILKTAIETFTRMAIEAAVLRGSTGGLGFLGGILAVGAVGGGVFKGIKLQEGGIVRRPTIAQVGEGGPEAVIPLHRLESLGVGGSPHINLTITQNNTISVQGVNDEHVRELMRRISEATRNGAAEGAELVKSVFSRQSVTRQAV